MFTQTNTNKNSSNKKMIYILVTLLILVVFYLFINYTDYILYAKNVETTDENEHLIINEVSSNKSIAYSNLYDENFDWIELYNPSEKDVNLNTYYISDKEGAPYKYNLPDLKLKGKAYIIIYASGYNLYKENEIHTNFKISSKGETILLTNTDQLVSKMIVPRGNKDFSYGYGENGVLGYLAPITPLQKNGASYLSIDDYYNYNTKPNGIYINEYMSKGQGVIHDENGIYSDWVELINTTDADINLKDYCLTDDLNEPYRFFLPDVIIEKQKMLLVFLDGKDVLDSQYIHANFSLSSSDRLLSLFDNNHNLIDSVKVVDTEETISYGRNIENNELWQCFSIPTPNQPNIFEGSAQKKTLFDKETEYVLINEVKPISSDHEVYGDFDWIELYNNSNKTINLAGFGLSDSKNDLSAWVFPEDVLLQPDAYLLVLATGNNTVDQQGNYHTNFTLNAGIEDVFLTSNHGYLVDKMAARHVNNNHSIGKSANGESYIFKVPTPNAPNQDDVFDGYAQKVMYSKKAGNYTQALLLELFTNEAAAEIYYTLDGTTPTSHSAKYTTPLNIDKDTTVCAVTVKAQKLDSEIVSQGYIFNKDHDLPIVMITCKPDYLYGSGGLFIYATRDKEVPVKIEIFEPDNKDFVSFDAQMKLFGNTSLYAPQKSLAIEVENNYGENSMVYDLFPNDAKTPRVYRSFVLRNGGSGEWNRTKLTDASLINLARLGLNVDAQAYRPCAVYINGEYYGLLNMREKLNRDYIETKYGFNRSDVSIVQPITHNNGYEAIHGSIDDFNDMVRFIRNNDISKQENYEHIKAQLDIDNYIDTILVHILSGNKDSGNIKFWKANEEGTKWRVFLFDLDRAAYYPTINHLLQRTSINGHGAGKLYDTSILRGLLENEAFAYQFSKRAVELIDTLYSPEFSIAYYNHLASKMETEMGNHLDIWWEYSYNEVILHGEYSYKPKNKEKAQQFVYFEQDRHRNFFEERQSYVLRFFMSYFDMTDDDIKTLRRKIATENNAPTRIYNEFMQTGDIEKAIEFSNLLDTVYLDNTSIKDAK